MSEEERQRLEAITDAAWDVMMQGDVLQVAIDALQPSYTVIAKAKRDFAIAFDVLHQRYGEYQRLYGEISC